MNDKQLIAEYAAKKVKKGMLVGLGTGSSANCFIEALAHRIHHENLAVAVVSSSTASTSLIRELGIPPLSLGCISQLDLYVDGADEVGPNNALLKGQGGDLVMEKLLAFASNEFIALADSSKKVANIGDKFPIPIEVIPAAWEFVQNSLRSYEIQGGLRKYGNAPVVSSHGSLILDITFPPELSTMEIEVLLNSIPGVVEHGIFYHLANTVLMAKNGKVVATHLEI